MYVGARRNEKWTVLVASAPVDVAAVWTNGMVCDHKRHTRRISSVSPLRLRSAVRRSAHSRCSDRSSDSSANERTARSPSRSSGHDPPSTGSCYVPEGAGLGPMTCERDCRSSTSHVCEVPELFRSRRRRWRCRHRRRSRHRCTCRTSRSTASVGDGAAVLCLHGAGRGHQPPPALSEAS
jgi:hypothetical protein